MLDGCRENEELEDKFRRSASRILNEDEIDAPVKYLLELEAVENVLEFKG